MALRLLEMSPRAASTGTGPVATDEAFWSRRYVLVLVCLLLLVFGYYIWTGATSDAIVFDNSGDIYNQLTTAFLHGHLYLPERPPTGLLRLKDPYNPTLNAPFAAAFHDLALYRGRFYSEWGPTPVLTLFAPFRLTGLRMSQTFAVALYMFVGCASAVLLMHAVVRRYIPGTPKWMLLLATLGVGTMNVGGFLLRRPAQYEVAISSGYCFEMLGLALVLTSVLGSRIRRARMAFGSLCLGLAMGGRPDLFVGGAVAVAVAVWCTRWRGESRRILVWAVGPLLVFAVLLLAYNFARFGQATNFGDKYQLAGIDQLRAPYYKLKWILPGMVSYLALPARLALTFPHAFLTTSAQVPFSLPKGYIGAPGTTAPEPVGGVLSTAPITLTLLVLPLLWRRYGPAGRGVLVLTTGLAALGFVICLLLSWGIFGTTERYEVDFATLLVMPAFLAWALVLARLRHRGRVRYRLAAGIGVVLSAFGVFSGLAFGITGYYNALETEHPSTFEALEDVTGPVQTLATIIAGSPQIARVYSTTEAASLPVTGYGTWTDNDAAAYLGTGVQTLTVVSPRSEHAALIALAQLTPGLPLGSTYIRVALKGRPTGTVPILGESVRIPVVLHTGINRIGLTLAGATATNEVLLQGLKVEGGG